MVLRFKIHYHTNWGEQIKICGSLAELGDGNLQAAPFMTADADGHWFAEINLSDDRAASFSYKYALVREGTDAADWEWGAERQVTALESCDVTTFEDAWRPAQADENAWFSSAFTRVLMKRKTNGAGTAADVRAAGRSLFRFQVYAPRISPDKKLAIIGSDPALGNWEETAAVVMDDAQYPLFRTQLTLENPDKVEYKYVIFDKRTGKAETWEAGENRRFHAAIPTRQRRCYVRTDAAFRHPSQPWKGAGLAIPVFSLRSATGMGVGEFTDLKPLTDWAGKTGMKMIQILPVNDTVATHTWKDSYPYAAISVFALHPLYMNLDDLAGYYDQRLSRPLEAERKKLNAQDQIDYEAVMQVKSRYYKALYDRVSEDFLKDPAFLAFFAENKKWLLPYALFSYLRDVHGTPAFSEWPTLSTFDWQEAEKLAAPGTPHYADIAIHYFIQFHLDRQLVDAVRYAREQGVVMQGDIPIGIYRNSVDAWVAPRLYHMDSQAGAPPDAYAVAGQNWRFPTYNWQEMASDGFAWWKWRLQHMARYFDAYRIDHILGFFRIWEIPAESVQGLMGHFNPALPLYVHELEQRGISFDYERLCQPYIRAHFLEERMGGMTERVKREFLDEYQPGCFRLKPPFATQRAIEEYIETLDLADVEKVHLREGLFSLVAEVLLLEAPETGGHGFHPRIALHFTRSYQDLDGHTKHALNEIYDDYFYHRHEQFWRDQAMQKLPAIMGATDMLVIGEDLGMVPDCVPGVMQELGLLSLEIQRMPKNPSQDFVDPAQVPYLSVASPSCHDMSTIRGWWEEDRELTEKYYHKMLGHAGSMPYFCEPWVAREINLQHLWGNSMWAIFPIQDLLAMDADLRLEDPQAERINVPSNPEHYWRYRLHTSLESLVKAGDFNDKIRQMVAESGRLSD